MGSLYERQKARLQDEQVRWCSGGDSPSEARSRWRERGEVVPEDFGGLSAMMVLLLKQTHLQKDVAEAVLVRLAGGWAIVRGISCGQREYVWRL